MLTGKIDTLDSIQLLLVILVSVLVAHYIYVKWAMSAASRRLSEDVEAFANPDGPDGDSVILGNDHLYDEFYAKIYDQIVGGEGREEVEVNYALNWAKSYRPEEKTLKVLDVGCGTGGAVDKFRAAGVGKVVGLDASTAMVAAARKRFPKGDYRVGEVEQIGQFTAGEFNLATLFYFTYYYLRDPDMALKNLFNWLEPGGCLMIHLVNREKFDPILEAASPFVGFSLQKYSKKRVTRSKVAFDKFDYEADFSLEGDRAEFREEFAFKNGRVRKQTHTMRMPRMEQVVGIVESAGFTYKQFIDLTPIGYEYQYLFCFVR